MTEPSSMRPRVSVCVVTYNHEGFIRQCLQSLVDQETTFDFEIVVADDCSTDRTRQIAQEFVDRYPDRVVPLFHPRNVGALRNFVAVHKAARGEYIAHMDGDDYALPGKLQAQAEVLDAHPECNVVWHPSLIIFPDGRAPVEGFLPKRLYPRDGFRRRDIMAIGSVGCHSSKMYRASQRFEVSDGFEYIDWYADVRHVGEGSGRYVPRVLGAYRAGIGLTRQRARVTEIYLKNIAHLAELYPDDKRFLLTQALRFALGDLRRGHVNAQAMRLAARFFSFRGAASFTRTTALLKFDAGRPWPV